MNKERRNAICKLVDKAKDLQQEIENILADEEEAFENMNGFQNTLRGMNSEDAISNLSDAVDEVDEVIECLENAVI